MILDAQKMTANNAVNTLRLLSNINYENDLLDNIANILLIIGRKDLIVPIRQYSFILNNSEYSDKKIASTLHLNASTEINLWLSKSGNVIGLDFIQVKEK